MPNRTLEQDELELLFSPLLRDVRERLERLADGDHRLLWALRRKLAKELVYDERGKPMYRRALKKRKRAEQNGCCVLCHETLPERGSVLDRLEAMDGYTDANTRLISDHPSFSPTCCVRTSNKVTHRCASRRCGRPVERHVPSDKRTYLIPTFVSEGKRNSTRPRHSSIVDPLSKSVDATSNLQSNVSSRLSTAFLSFCGIAAHRPSPNR
jgi:hypothetical protein